MPKAGNKGIILFVVLMTVIIAFILGSIVLNTMLSQNRLGHHKVSRIQAYYAGLAGLRYASEMLRQHSLNPATSSYAVWVPSDSVPGTNCVCAFLCRTSTCSPTLSCPSFCPAPIVTITDPNMPGQVNAVEIVIGESHSGTGGKTRKIVASVDYTLQ